MENNEIPTVEEIKAAERYIKHNELSAIEIKQKALEIKTQLRTLRAYFLAYGRDWGENMNPFLESIDEVMAGYDVYYFEIAAMITDMALKHYREKRR